MESRSARSCSSPRAVCLLCAIAAAAVISLPCSAATSTAARSLSQQDADDYMPGDYMPGDYTEDDGNQPMPGMFLIYPSITAPLNQESCNVTLCVPTVAVEHVESYVRGHTTAGTCVELL